MFMKQKIKKQGNYIFILSICTFWITVANAQLTIGPASAPVLNFPQALGNKILLAGNANTYHTGIGVQSTVLQLYVPPDGSSAFIFNDILSGIFYPDFYTSEIMRVTNQGNVGIAKADPTSRLDINGSMRIRSTPGSTAGTWLQNNNLIGNAFFMGMQNDESFGFFHVNSGSWKLTVSAPYGHIALNGTTGEDGALLSSNGGGQPAAWQIRSNQNYYNLSTEAAEVNSYFITDGAAVVNPGGLYVKQDYTEPTKVEAIFNVQAQGSPCFLCGITDFIIRVMLDDNPVRGFRYTAENGFINTYSGSTLMSLAPGTHIISLQVQKISGPTLQLSNDGGRWSNLNLVCSPTN